MSRRILLLSGPVASGKSTLARSLAEAGFHIFKTRDLIHSLEGTLAERAALQAAGERLDRQTKGAWLANALAREAARLPEDSLILVDSVRIVLQVDAIRRAFGSRVLHIHLTAPEVVLRQRYDLRHSEMKELPSYGAVIANATEANIEELANVSDLVIDTDRNTSADVLVRARSFLGMYGGSPERLVDVLVGGQFGSEGKGQVAAYLAPEYDVLVRVGGPNAGHSVYEEPAPYVFHHLPSGTRATERLVLLGPGSVLWLDGLLKEISDCIAVGGRLFIDPQAMIIEEEDRKLEVRKLRRSIGSTSQGIGSATARKVLRTAATPKVRLARDLRVLKPYLKETLTILDEAFSKGQRVFLEGTQGSGLSLHHGSYPFVTSRDTTVGGCLAEAGIAPSRVRRIMLVCRTYPIRVGEEKGRNVSGPMQKEIDWETISKRSGIAEDKLTATERTSTTNRPRRVSEFDWGLYRRSVSLNGPTDIVLTFADYLDVKNSQALRFEQLTPETIKFIEELERVGCAPVSLIATRFHSRSIIDRRSWRRI